MNNKIYILLILVLVNICLTIYILYKCFNNKLKEGIKIKAPKAPKIKDITKPFEKAGNAISDTAGQAGNAISDTARQAEEAARREAERVAEATRQAEEAARREAERLAEEARRQAEIAAEEARRQAERLQQLVVNDFFDSLLEQINRLLSTVKNTTKILGEY